MAFSVWALEFWMHGRVVKEAFVAQTT